tara:strand:+ start:349 stop:1473 length:1125 start_codon:yes stop_codon:yes gene_type:complete
MKKNDSESNSFDKENQGDTNPKALSEEVFDGVDLEFSEETIKEEQEVSFNKNYILLGIIIFLAIAGLFFAFVNQSNIQNSEASQNQELDTSPVTTVASPSAISEAMELGKLIGCDTLHFDLEYGRLPCGDKETYLEKMQLYENQRLTTRLYGITFVFLIILTLLIYLIFRQARQHKSIELNGEKFLMPSEWAQLINYLAQGSQNNEEILKKLFMLNQELPENFLNLKNTFLELQKKLDSQDTEIDRLKKGYDNHITKKIITRFIKVFEYVGDLKNINSEDNNLKNISLLLEDALADCNVSEFNPELKSDFREVEGIDANPEIIETNVRDLNFKIAEVKKPGFIISYQDSVEILQPAYVSVYKFTEESNKKEEQK